MPHHHTESGHASAFKARCGFFLYEKDIRNHQKASRYKVIDETYSLSTSTLYSKAIGAKVFSYIFENDIWNHQIALIRSIRRFFNIDDLTSPS